MSESNYRPYRYGLLPHAPNPTPPSIDHRRRSQNEQRSTTIHWSSEVSIISEYNTEPGVLTFLERSKSGMNVPNKTGHFVAYGVIERKDDEIIGRCDATIINSHVS